MNEYKLVVLGGGGVGKSALVVRLVTDNFVILAGIRLTVAGGNKARGLIDDRKPGMLARPVYKGVLLLGDDYDPTIEDSYRKQVMIDNEQALLDILDTAGQEEFSSMQDQWMRDGKGFLLVYNITSRPTFDEVLTLHQKLLRTKEADKVPVVLVGNKCDLKDQRQVELSEGQSLAEQWGASFFETSAKEKINTEACFFELVREIRKVEADSPGGATKKKGGFCTLL